MTELLDVVDVARLLKVSPRTVYGYAQRGVISYKRIGGVLRFTMEQLEELLERSDRPSIEKGFS